MFLRLTGGLYFGMVDLLYSGLVFWFATCGSFVVYK